MSTRTPITGVTIPDSSDDLGDFLGAVVQGFVDLQNFLYLTLDSKKAGDAHTTYPVGISLLPLSIDTPAAGWPTTIGVTLVITIRRSNTNNGAVQFWVGFTAAEPQIKVRTGGNTGWSPWGLVAGPGLPVATDSGRVSFLNNSTSDQVTVTLASGRFKTAPNVVATSEGPAAVASVSAITTAGFTLRIDPKDGAPDMPSTGDRFVQWIAMENY